MVFLAGKFIDLNGVDIGFYPCEDIICCTEALVTEQEWWHNLNAWLGKQVWAVLIWSSSVFSDSHFYIRLLECNGIHMNAFHLLFDFCLQSHIFLSQNLLFQLVKLGQVVEATIMHGIPHERMAIAVQSMYPKPSESRMNMRNPHDCGFPMISILSLHGEPPKDWLPWVSHLIFELQSNFPQKGPNFEGYTDIYPNFRHTQISSYDLYPIHIFIFWNHGCIPVHLKVSWLGVFHSYPIIGHLYAHRYYWSLFIISHYSFIFCDYL